MRVGRGIGSGKGKTRDVASRPEVAHRAWLKGFEGGRCRSTVACPSAVSRRRTRSTGRSSNVGTLQKAIDEKKIDAGKLIDAAAMQAAGLFKQALDGVRLLGNGEIKSKIEVKVAGASASAIAAVEKAAARSTAAKPWPRRLKPTAWLGFPSPYCRCRSRVRVHGIRRRATCIQPELGRDR